MPEKTINEKIEEYMSSGFNSDEAIDALGLDPVQAETARANFDNYQTSYGKLSPQERLLRMQHKALDVFESSMCSDNEAVRLRAAELVKGFELKQAAIGGGNLDEALKRKAEADKRMQEAIRNRGERQDNIVSMSEFLVSVGG